jgi:hypothetical protein
MDKPLTLDDWVWLEVWCPFIICAVVFFWREIFR